MYYFYFLLNLNLNIPPRLKIFGDLEKIGGGGGAPKPPV
jgi:hypothetical protein